MNYISACYQPRRLILTYATERERERETSTIVSGIQKSEGSPEYQRRQTATSVVSRTSSREINVRFETTVTDPKANSRLAAADCEQQ